jgi:E3 ubiquitin-protein ligase RNF13
MSVSGVDARQAQTLLDQGYRCLDVRTIEEFALGHVPGSFNVPVQHAEGDMLYSNPDFVAVTLSAFALDTRLIVTCHASARAERACEALQRAGYYALLRLQNGWQGRRDAFGRLIPGWSPEGLPVEVGDGGERSYRALLQRAALRS